MIVKKSIFCSVCMEFTIYWLSKSKYSRFLSSACTINIWSPITFRILWEDCSICLHSTPVKEPYSVAICFMLTTRIFYNKDWCVPNYRFVFQWQQNVQFFIYIEDFKRPAIQVVRLRVSSISCIGSSCPKIGNIIFLVPWDHTCSLPIHDSTSSAFLGLNLFIDANVLIGIFQTGHHIFGLRGQFKWSKLVECVKTIEFYEALSRLLDTQTKNRELRLISTTNTE